MAIERAIIEAARNGDPEALRQLRAAAMTGDTDAADALRSLGQDMEREFRLPDRPYVNQTGGVGSLAAVGAKAGMVGGGAISALPRYPALTGGAYDPTAAIGAYAGAQSSANRANMQRYNQILAELSGMGQSQSIRIGRTARQSKASLAQELTNRGLGNATVVGPMLQRIDENTNLQRIDLADTLRQQRAGVMERRTDAGPNTGQMSSLLQSAGYGVRSW